MSVLIVKDKLYIVRSLPLSANMRLISIIFYESSGGLQVRIEEFGELAKVYLQY